MDRWIQLSPGRTHRAGGFTTRQGIWDCSTAPMVLAEFLDTPRAAMIKMVYSTGDLPLPRLTRVPHPDCRILVDVRCLATSPQFTGPLVGVKRFALSKVTWSVFNKLRNLAHTRMEHHGAELGSLCHRHQKSESRTYFVTRILHISGLPRF